jgi:hypothetical protein
MFKGKQSIWEFLSAFWRNWLPLMCGVFSVPFAGATAFVETVSGRVIWATMALGAYTVASYLVWSTERKKVIELEGAVSERDQQKRQLLDDIASLREQMVQFRIEMEAAVNQRQYDEKYWKQKYDDLEQAIASKIERLAGGAEAITYRNRGNIPRPISPVAGGFQNPVLLDACIYDLNYLKDFIHDYSRHRPRSQ